MTTQTTEQLAHEGMELHEYNAPEYIVCAAFLRQLEEIKRLTADNVQTNRLYEETLEFNDEWRKQSMAQAAEIESLKRFNDVILEGAALAEKELHAEIERQDAEYVAQGLRLIDAEREIERLRRACNLYDMALKSQNPEGATGATFDYWNAARAALGDVCNQGTSARPLD